MIMILLLALPSLITLFMPIRWLLAWASFLFLAPWVSVPLLAYIWTDADDGSAFLVAMGLVTIPCYAAFIPFLVRMGCEALESHLERRCEARARI